ncbi:hypothetical protein QWL27_11975 [Streptomyces thermocarboxydus]|nr:hypothetical protein [Streptomyces thermocarboxydus]
MVRTLLFEVGRDRVDTVLAADAGVLNTTEGHRTADGAIGGDPDSAGADALRERKAQLMSALHIPAPRPSRLSLAMAPASSSSMKGMTARRSRRPPRRCAGVADAGENGGLDEPAVAALCRGGGGAAECEPGAFLAGDAEAVEHLEVLGGCHDGPDLGVLVQRKVRLIRGDLRPLGGLSATHHEQ